MKQIISFILLFLAFLFSCEDDKDTGKRLSFGRAIYILRAQSPLDIDLRLEGDIADKTLTIPFTISGSAVEGKDFAISAREFVIPPGENVAHVTLTPLANYTAEREIRLELGEVPGYSLWNNKVAIIPIETKEYIVCSFERNWMELEAEYDLKISVAGALSGKYNSDTELRIPFEIVDDPNKTTAIKGVHYELAEESCEFIIPPGKSEASMKLSYLIAEENRNKITFRLLLPDTTFQFGNYAEAVVKIVGPMSFDKLEGVWNYTSFASEDMIRGLIGSDDEFLTDLENLPTSASTSGSIEFIKGNHANSGKMISNLSGDLSHFLQSCDVTLVGTEQQDLWDTEEMGVWITNATFNPVNYYFSATEVNNREAIIGMRFLDGGKTLEIRIIDCELKDFLTLTQEFLGLELTPLVFHFTRMN